MLSMDPENHPDIEIDTLGIRSIGFRYRKNKASERIGAYAKAHPASVLARSANMFIDSNGDCDWNMK